MNSDIVKIPNIVPQCVVFCLNLHTHNYFNQL